VSTSLFALRRRLGDAARTPLPGHPQSVQQHRQTARHGHHGTLLRRLPAALRHPQAAAAQVRVGPERTQDVVRSAHQQPPQQTIPALRDPKLGLLLSRVPVFGAQPEVRPHRTALRKPSRILDREHEAERRDRTDPLT